MAKASQTAAVEASATRLAEFLPFHKPFLGDEEIAEVVDTLQSGWLTLGPKTARLEEKFAAVLGCSDAVAVSSCTAALHLALVSAGIGPGDEVITTPYTFTSTAAVILHTGATVVLADTYEDYPNIDPCLVADKVSSRTKAIIPVHFAGVPCDLDALASIARTCGAKIIEDAAHSLPSTYKGRRIGTIGDATAFSLYAGKNITAGEGGILATDDKGLAETVRRRRLHGISRDAWKRYSAEGSWYYEVTELGYKYNMTDINAAIALHQLDRMGQFHASRQKLVALYSEVLEGLDGVTLPSEPVHGESSWHLYVVHIDEEALSCSRGDVIEMLKADNIGSSVHFIPLHHHAFYQETLGCSIEDFPNATRLYRGAISLPLFPTMSEDDVRAVARSLTRIVEENRR